MSFTTLFFERSYQNLIRPVLFRLDPELVHDRFTSFGTWLGRSIITRALTRYCFYYAHPALEQELSGLKFENPVGLSAGFDKDANLQQIMPEVGFGFMEIGTVTLKPYEGNPKPRLLRLLKSKALVVNYGLKNIGAIRIAQKLRGYQPGRFNLGLSVGKTNSPKTASTSEAIEDYYKCLKTLVRVKAASFFVINISCPNTFGGEPFTSKAKLVALLSRLDQLKLAKPVFLKLPINLDWKEFEPLLKLAVKYKLAGVIIGNLNKDRGIPEIKDPVPKKIKGGISGMPTQRLSDELIGKTYKRYGQQLIIIGTGGIFSAADAYRKIRQGASLVSLITGMIYQGPQLTGAINRELVELLHQDGFTSIEEAVGADYRSK
jgi:dihydroorotate dehydrogenase subfamily 2